MTGTDQPDWMDKVERWPLDKLIPNPRNPRTHHEAQIAALAGSMREWGVTFPILIDEIGTVLAGHAKLAAARRLGLADMPVIVARGWSRAQGRAYGLADNRIALSAGWDEELLGIELADLKADGFDMTLLGFDVAELAALLTPKWEGDADPDDAPPVPKTPVSKVGDVWLCGRHRVVCGDATKPEDAARALGQAKPRLMVTDPPYGVSYDASWRAERGQSSPGAALGPVLNDDRADWREAFALFPGAVAYVWHGAVHSGEVANSLAAVGYEIRAQIVWVKSRPVLSRGAYHWAHEPVFYAVKPGHDDGWRFTADHETAVYAVKAGATAGWVGGRKQSTVWTIEHLKSETGHSTQKPVECMRRPMVNNSAPGECVYDPFLGSGTSVIAAEMTGRACHGLELDPSYVDVIVQRWEGFTGEKARREGAGGGRRGVRTGKDARAKAKGQGRAQADAARAPVG